MLWERQALRRVWGGGGKQPRKRPKGVPPRPLELWGREPPGAPSPQRGHRKRRRGPDPAPTTQPLGGLLPRPSAAESLAAIPPTGCAAQGRSRGGRFPEGPPCRPPQEPPCLPHGAGRGGVRGRQAAPPQGEATNLLMGGALSAPPHIGVAGGGESPVRSSRPYLSHRAVGGGRPSRHPSAPPQWYLPNRRGRFPSRGAERPLAPAPFPPARDTPASVTSHCEGWALLRPRPDGRREPEEAADFERRLEWRVLRLRGALPGSHPETLRAGEGGPQSQQ